MVYQNRTTPSARKSPQQLDWNTRPTGPAGANTRHLRRYMVIPSISNPGSPDAVVCQ